MSDEYIRREDAKDALQEKVFHNLTDEFYGAMQAIDELPSADVVQVVRCQNCKHHAYDEIFCCYWCEYPGMVRETTPDGFCDKGEEREHE